MANERINERLTEVRPAMRSDNFGAKNEQLRSRHIDHGTRRGLERLPIFGAEEESAMIIVGFGLAAIVASTFFSWLGMQRLRTSWRTKKARRSRVQYYQRQRNVRDYSERAQQFAPARWP
jgi:hypothetical protein